MAGENLRFAGASLAEAKILMGTLQDVSNLTRLPYKPLDKVGKDEGILKMSKSSPNLFVLIYIYI